MKKNIDILVVDDHSMVKEGMKTLLSKLPFVGNIHTANDAFIAMQILKEQPVELAFLDINLPDINGIELCKNIKNTYPSIQIIGLSTFNQRSYVVQMIKNGANGYLLKSADLEEIEQAIAAVWEGKMYISPDIKTTMTENADDPPTLTRREKEILTMISEGMTNNAIAEKIFLSPYTVDTHRKNLLAKFNAANTAILIKKAGQAGLI